MKIYDCTTFYDEGMMMDVRFNVLNNDIHKFIVVESNYSHSGKKKDFNFDINNYPKFKDKIIYLDGYKTLRVLSLFDGKELCKNSGKKDRGYHRGLGIYEKNKDEVNSKMITKNE